MRHPRIIIASDRPGQVTGQGFQNFFRLLAAPGAGPVCALVAWRLTPWIARAGWL